MSKLDRKDELPQVCTIMILWVSNSLTWELNLGTQTFIMTEVCVRLYLGLKEQDKSRFEHLMRICQPVTT